MSERNLLFLEAKSKQVEKPAACSETEVKDDHKQQTKSPNEDNRSEPSASTILNPSICSQITGDFTIMLNLACLSVIWLSVSFCYYLIAYQLKYIKGDLYINAIASSASEVVADALAGTFLQYLGIRLVLQFSYMVSLIGMAALIFYQGHSNALFALFVIGSKFGIASAFNVAYCANNLVFPVGIVATTYGICNFIARVATMAAPYVAEMYPEWIPKMIFCIVVFLALIAATVFR